MGYSLLKVVAGPNGPVIVTAGEARKGGAYIAVIAGPDPRYGLKRIFVGSSGWTQGMKGIKEVVATAKELPTPALLEIRSGGSWKNDYRGLYVWDGCKLGVIRGEAKIGAIHAVKAGADPAEVARKLIPQIDDDDWIEGE